jgi:predicted PurR-regulated permease PerM
MMAAAGVAVGWLDLGPALLAGLISYLLVTVVHRGLFAWQLARSLRADASDRASGRVLPMGERLTTTAIRLLAVGLFVLLALLVLWIFGMFFHLAVLRLPAILETAIPKIDKLAEARGVDLPFESLAELRPMLLSKFKENAFKLTHVSGLLTRRFFQIFVMVFAAVTAFWTLTDRRESPSLYTELGEEFRARVALFLLGFERIFGAQVAISFINMWLTVVFLRTMGLPYVPFLALSTFVLGLLPLVGNLMSNSLIVVTALSLSPQTAVIALAYLVIVHKAEYFLNSKIVGTSIDTPMWQILIGLIIGEALLGVPGVVLAPAFLHYMREELRLLPPDALEGGGARSSSRRAGA